MAYIKVDHKKFEHAASAIDTYVSRHKGNMSKIEQEMVALSGSWQGADYNVVKKQWDEIYASGSTSAMMLKALSNYAGYLRTAGKSYKNAQSRAVNRANNLPQW